MALYLQQTDTDGPCLRGSYYTGVTWSSAGFDRSASVNGSPGSGLYSVTCVRDGLPGSTAWGCVFACTIPNGYRWGSGDWVVRLRTTPFFGGVLYWTGLRIVRMSDACLEQDILGQDVGFSIECTNAVHERTISCSGTNPGSGDHIGVALQFTNEHPLQSQTIQVTPSQIIDCPFTRLVPRLLLTGAGT